MSNLTSLKIIAKSLADSLEPEWGCYISSRPADVIYKPLLPEMRFNFPVVVYFDREHATGVSYISGEVLKVEYADRDAYPDLLISKIDSWRSDSITKNIQ